MPPGLQTVTVALLALELLALLALELVLLLKLTTPSCGKISRVCPSDHLKRYAASPSLVPA
jgi:hypothetical protein